MVTTFPTLETAIIRVTNISRVEVGDKIRSTIDGERIGYPPTFVQVSTLSEWMASLCQRARELEKPLEVGFRNYGHGERRLITVEWAS